MSQGGMSQATGSSGRDTTLSSYYREVRAQTETLSSPLSAEDQTAQSMPDVSPTKWHRAHTTWFFETFVLRSFLPGYVAACPAYEQLFNSYYNSIGAQFKRERRGHITRPGAQEITVYRAKVDEAMTRLLATPRSDEAQSELTNLVTLGLHHEQQHQELLLTDIKHVLFQNPLQPAYNDRADETVPCPGASTSPTEFLDVPGGMIEVGFQGDGFHFDNEGPRHRALVDSFQIATKPLTNADVLTFIRDGGYHDPLLWLSDGWAFRERLNLEHPLYWLRDADGAYQHFTLHGVMNLPPDDIACHLSYFEADALARFFDSRLPTEQEWEHAATRLPIEDRKFQLGSLHPGPAATASDEPPGERLHAMMGGVWEWTQSPYIGYPGYEAPPGAIGEYNGKFMHNQMVLRGGSCATPPGHARKSYRNFFPGSAQWQFTGVRLARKAQK